MAGAIPRRELTLILTDLYLPPEVREALAVAVEPPAALPVLEHVFARASAREARDWRELAAAVAGVHVSGAMPVAAVSVAACAREVDRTVQWWVLTPVCLQAAHDHVKLAQVVPLQAGEWAQVAAGLQREFGADLASLRIPDPLPAPGAGAEAYVAVREPLEATTTDPLRIVGRDVSASLPEGAQGGMLRRLMTELQMWLHGHPINVEREMRGLPTANALWFWGGGVLPAQVRNGSAAELPALYSDDCFLRGLWTLRGKQVASLPQGAEARRMTIAGSFARAAIASLSLAELPGNTWQERLGALDREWLGPIVGAMRAGGLEKLALQVNDVLWTLRARDLWRVWRRPRPWLEAIA